MQIKKEINKLCVNKQRQSMKIKSICRNQWQKKEALCKQTAYVLYECVTKIAPIFSSRTRNLNSKKFKGIFVIVSSGSIKRLN